MSNFSLTLSMFIESIEDQSKRGTIKYAEMTRDGIDVSYEGSNEKLFVEDIKKILNKKFNPKKKVFLSVAKNKNILRMNSEDEDIYITFIKKTKNSSSSGRVPTAIQEAGTAYILTEALNNKNNSRFTSASSILNDKDLMKGLERIFKSHKNKIKDWVHSYYEHQRAFFDEFSKSDWKEFEHGGQKFMEFIKRQANNVKVKTTQGKLVDVGKYETWNPTDIWAIKNSAAIRQEIENAIDGDGQTLDELNGVLYKLMTSKPEKLIGLSLKKIDPSAEASFMYINKDPRYIEFAEVEKIKMSDIKMEIKTSDSTDGMNQGAYVLFGKYTINVIRSSGNKFTNLKFESVIKGSGARGGAAPVDLVADLLKNDGIIFENKHQNYPQTAEEFLDDKDRDYEKMYNSLKSHITGSSDFNEFKRRIILMYESNDQKKIAVAQSKLMQLHFFFVSWKKQKGDNQSEFWTNLLYLSLKVGNRFAPHGKLA